MNESIQVYEGDGIDPHPLSTALYEMMSKVHDQEWMAEDVSISGEEEGKREVRLTNPTKSTADKLDNIRTCLRGLIERDISDRPVFNITLRGTKQLTKIYRNRQITSIMMDWKKVSFKKGTKLKAGSTIKTRMTVYTIYWTEL